MAQWPRWAREQMLREKLKEVLQNPYADVSQVQAAEKAIKMKLDQQDNQYQQDQQKRTNDYLKRLGSI
jgi:hypothetical protein